MSSFQLIAEQIQRRYRYVKTISDLEVQQILLHVSIIQKSGGIIDENTIRLILDKFIINKRRIIHDSLDMSPTMSVLNQILAAVEQQKK